MAKDGSVIIEIDGDSKKFSKALGGIKNVASTAFTSMAVAATAAGAAVVTLGKQAITAYADYEQLVGGVETLFKDSAGVVNKYAANAYKTAGLSANAYMETVTSFSASLLQSLGGDTAAAAKVADMAITDMADNANKMGTSMEAIRNAYQGFAKQNYTMLDNLKLGYGGTKTEMERLLADAQKISGVKYDITNLNDVYEAIHVIQGEIGITGTTAKEAGSTIQGSAAAMSAAWKNLLVGMADDTQDFDTLLKNFIDSIGTFGENLLPRIEIALGGLASLAEKLIPKIAEMLPKLAAELLPKITQIAVSIVQNLLNGLTSNLPLLTTAAVDIVFAFANAILNMLPQILDAGAKLLVSLAKGIADKIPELIPVVINTIFAIIDTITANLDDIILAGVDILLALVDGIINSIPVMTERIPEIIEKLVNALTNPEMIQKLIDAAFKIIFELAKALIVNLPEMHKAAFRVMGAFFNGIWNIAVGFWGKAQSIVTDYIIKPISEKISEMIPVGKNLISGLWQGISDSYEWLKNKVTGFFGGIVDGVKGFLGIHSPSKVFAELGGFTMEGFAIGMQNESGNTIKTAEELSEHILDTATAWVEDKKAVNDLAAADEVRFWEELKEIGGLGAEELKKVNQNIAKAKDKASKESFENSKKWIEKEKFYNRLSAAEEVEAWERVVKRKNLSLEEQEEAERNLYTAKKKLLDEQTKAEEEYQNKLEARTEKLRSFAGLFDEVKPKEDVSGKELLSNLKGQVESFKGWQSDLTALEGRGILSEALLAELREMGPKAAAEIKALTKLTDAELTEYVDLYAEKGKLAAEQAEKEIPKTKTTIEVDTEGLSEEDKGVVTSAANEVVDTTCETISERKEDFVETGIEAMTGLKEGLIIAGQEAIAAARAIADSIIAEMRRALDIHSPSRKMARLVGEPAAQGLFVGFENEIKGLSGKMQCAVDLETSKLSANITAQTEERNRYAEATNTVKTNTKVVEKTTKIEFSGTGADIARLLRPTILKEDTRVGKQLIGGLT